MKNKALKILNLIFALFLAVFSISYVFAWFADGTKVPLNVGGQASAYFAYGDGTESDPYGITDPIHLYNLSWLQNSGKFDDTTYYFEINENLEGALDMSGYWLAPIGNFEHPFKGVFNGSGKTIKGLQVTTNKSLLQSNDPAKYSSYLFSNAVGFFGKTGSSAQIRNFILDNPKVEVEAGDEMYCSTTETGTDGQVVDTKVVGFAVGEDNGSTTDGTTTTAAISNIGVIGGVLSVQRADYQTKNAIIGSTALQGSTDGDTTSGNTGYFDPTVMNDMVTAHTSLYSEGFAHEKFIVSSDANNGLGSLGLGAFKISTTRSNSDNKMEFDNDRQYIIGENTNYIAINSSNDSSVYPQYVIGAANTSTGSNTTTIYSTSNNNTAGLVNGLNEDARQAVDNVLQWLVPANGWGNRTEGLFEYYMGTGGQSNNRENSDPRFDVFEDTTDTGSNANVRRARTIKFDIFKMGTGSPSILILAASNNSSPQDLTIQRYSVTKTVDGQTVSTNYADYYNIESDTPVNDDYTEIDGLRVPSWYTYQIQSNAGLTLIYQTLPNVEASYGIDFDGSTRVYFMRVVGVAGTDTYGEGSLDSIDFIAEGDTMVYSNGTVTFNYVETGTLIGLSGNGASIIIGFIREATTVGEGDSATTTYTFSVTYSAVAATEPGSTYSPNPTVSNVVTVGENESFTGSEDSLFPESLAS